MELHKSCNFNKSVIEPHQLIMEPHRSYFNYWCSVIRFIKIHNAVLGNPLSTNDVNFIDGAILFVYLLRRSFIRFIEIYEEIHKCYTFMNLHKLHISVALIELHE